MIRIAHLSDIHITASPLGWGVRDWFNKRFTSWLNVKCLGRGHRFARADEVLAILMDDIRQRAAEHVIFSGDATALGFDAEIRRAAEMLNVAQRPGLAVPGNHDYLTHSAAQSGSFERHFATWQTGQRLDGVYPFAQRVGPVWLIGVNSAVGHVFWWDASGNVGRMQRQRLRRLLAELPPGPRLLVTHYPVCLANGHAENRVHDLRDLSEMITIASEGNVAAWLHGHRHRPYVVEKSTLAPFPVVCVGSATQTNLWSYNEYAVDDCLLRASRRSFDPGQRCFHETGAFQIPLTV